MSDNEPVGGWEGPLDEYVRPLPTIPRKRSDKALFVLGASDPEMAEIEAVVLAAGHHVAYAMTGPDGDRQRVHPGNAYNPEWISNPGERNNAVYLVEAGFPPSYFEKLEAGPRLRRIDHHRPGDPGYGMPPEQYMQASSLGQVLDVLGLTPTDEQRIIAAADHCLMYVYQGQCPGVSPDDLMAWRIESRANFQGRNPIEVEADVNRARKAIAEAPKILIAGVEVADFGDRTLPELPEAAARDATPVLGTVTDRGGRRKAVLLSAPPTVITEFMESRKQSGLEVYGDPARGFAGAYREQKPSNRESHGSHADRARLSI